MRCATGMCSQIRPVFDGCRSHTPLPPPPSPPAPVIPTAASLSRVGPNGVPTDLGASLHMGPDGLTAPGLHVGADGVTLASTGGAVIDPGQAAAAAAMLNSAAATSGVRSVKLTQDGVTINPGAPDATSLQLNSRGVAVTAPRVGPNGTADGASGSATVQLALPSAGVNSTISALAPRLAFSLVPDAANGADIALGAGPGYSAAADAAADAAVAAGGGRPASGGVAQQQPRDTAAVGTAAGPGATNQGGVVQFGLPRPFGPFGGLPFGK